jgi:L-2-hydroxycarboxylate dehydrogenase (NAD+)
VKIRVARKLLIDIFLKHKLIKKHAEVSADALIYAELAGAPSHGIARVASYCNRIKKKVINPKPKIKIKKISSSICNIDANNGIGFIGADLGINIAIRNAKKTGIGLVAVKNSNHYGLSGYYAERAAKKGLVAFCFTNAPPALAPYGAKKKLFGTNPICFAAPNGTNAPFVLDTSVSKINRGKIRRAEKLGKKIPIDVALDKNGNPTTDPKEALKGLQLPIAEFRGSGLAWMVDILSGVLTGGNHAGKVKDPFDDFSGPQNIGHLFILFKPNLFVKNYTKRIKENIKKIKRLPKLKGVKKIYYPGENKAERLKNNLKKDIYIPANILKEINLLNKG